jgi:two-component system OmpR family sensor kinase
MPPTPLRPTTWTLRSQVLASVLLLFAIVMLITATVTVGFTKRQLDGQLHDELAGAQGITSESRSLPGPGPDGDDHRDRGPAQRNSSAVLRLALVDGQVATDGSGSQIATITAFGADREQLSDTQIRTLTQASSDLARHEERIDLGEGTGTYLLAAQTQGSVVVITGVPTGAADSTLGTLLRLVGLGTVLGLAIVGLGGNWLIRRNLAPLARVADTARQVSALKLDAGDVALPARVSGSDADPHTEVGQVGQALNRMLDNVEGALQTRHESETRVRQFVADASHELRTPLASIRGYAELSRREREPVPAGVTHALARVESEALRMQGLVEDLLLLARLDSGRPLEREPVDLTLLAMDCVSDAHAAAPDHVWELDLPDEPVEAPGDAGRLHQVIANLLANARTHTPPGTTVVTRVRKEGDEVRIDVADNGPGIPEALQPNVFERFTRGDDSRNRASGSTGLGLSIVAAVAGAHAGRVALESAPGRTVFTVRIPAGGAAAELSHEAAGGPTAT